MQLQQVKDFIKSNTPTIIKWLPLSLAAVFVVMFLYNGISSLFKSSQEEVLRQIRETKDSIHSLSVELSYIKKERDTILSRLESRSKLISSYEHKVYNLVLPKETNPDRAYDFLKTFAEKNGVTK